MASNNSNMSTHLNPSTHSMENGADVNTSAKVVDVLHPIGGPPLKYCSGWFVYKPTYIGK